MTPRLAKSSVRCPITAFLLAAGLLATACSSAPAPTPQIVYVTPQPVVAASPTVEPTPKSSSEPAANPAAVPTPPPTPKPTPVPAPALKLVRVMRSFPAGAGTNVMVFAAEYKNVGNAPGKMAGMPGWLLFGKDGSVLGSGIILYPIPQYIEPGKSVYLCGHILLDSGSTSVGKLEIDTPTIVPSSGPGIPIKVSNVKIVGDTRLYDESFQLTNVTGLLTNMGAENVEHGVIGVVWFDSKGRAIAGWTDNVSSTFIPAGARQRLNMFGVELIPDSIVRSAKKAIVIAYDAELIY